MKRLSDLTAVLAMSLGLCLSACGGSDDNAADTEGTGTTGTAGDTIPSNGDGNADGGGGNGSGPPCPLGSEGCPCSASDYCDFGLVCDEEGICGDAPAADGTGTDTGTGTAGTTDGTGDSGGSSDGSDGSTDGSTGTGRTCAGDEVIEVLAIDADTIIGFNQQTSGSGEGEILVHDGETPVASIEWELDIPCDDDWHIWVRALDFQSQDTFFVQVDDGPMPIPIFELDCTDGPQQGSYSWQELNWRDQAAEACDYVENPWVQENWPAGRHTFTLGYRPDEAFSVVGIWVTNTEDPPR